MGIIIPGDAGRLADRIAISETKARYCRALDTKDWEAYASVFTEDCEFDFTSASKLPITRDRDAAVARIRADVGDAITVHHVRSPEIAFNGNSAEVIWSLQERLIWGRLSIIAYGHYYERWVQQEGPEGLWKIAAIRITRLHTDPVPARK